MLKFVGSLPVHVVEIVFLTFLSFCHLDLFVPYLYSASTKGGEHASSLPYSFTHSLFKCECFDILSSIAVKCTMDN
jgi:hypothetical protein